MEKKAKKRIDVLLVERGLAPSRERAQGMLLAGQVLVGDTPIHKAGQLVAVDAEFRIRGQDHPYVSRGGIKLAAALEAFSIETQGREALDIGASTGGFTQVLLMSGVTKVFAVDVGHSQLDWKIRKDPRVVVLEKTNAKDMAFEIIGQIVDLIVVDVSFISLKKIFPTMLRHAGPKTDLITLIKPQFEVGRDRVGKGGIVTSEKDRQEVIAHLKTFAESLGVVSRGLIESPITGTQGNKEFLAHWKLNNLEKEMTTL